MSQLQWPEDASRQARDDFERLLPVAFRRAHQELSSHGEFWPFAVVVDLDGQQHLAAPQAERQRPGPGELLAALRRSLRAPEQPLRAVALVLDVHVPALGSDAVEVSLEHLGSPPVTVQRPYTRRRFGGRISYGADVSTPGTATVLTR
ncbi:hypothetical protein GC722_12245 [Auraticoccus sp. F435]|uniref:Uncharacterized protein n=1 Tax=Auraticoccus cholistanensis TaxID=2656650 RepID=A0A6A9UV12_9ACTN|nr:hypothetical protein [Auraticoccus cholistanensis]MVA76786.1 hypothetical protein [Auraticoccus cholistanensis]